MNGLTQTADWWTTTRRMLEMIRFSHTVFALPFALLSAVMAWQMPGTEFQWRHLVGIVLCMVTGRSVAMAVNRLADRRIDADNPRTQGRHLPSGTLTVAGVTSFVVLMAVAFVASTALFWPNWLPLALSLPVLIFLCGYSWTKRFTWGAHYWLGTALMLAPICAWIALRGELVLARPADILPAVALGLAVLLWVSGFDILYACQDYEFDRRAGLRSVPVRFGIPTALRIAAAGHLGMVILLGCLPSLSPELDWGWIYYTSVAAIAVLLAIEHYLVSPRDLTRVNVAFFHINAVVSLGLLATGALDLLTKY